MTNTFFNTRSITKMAILGAIAGLLMLIEFPLPIAPSFYKFDFSEVAVLIGGFAMGPMAAVVIEAIKVLLNFLFNGTITMGVGELASFLVGCALCVPASIIYHKDKTKVNAIKGLVVGTLCMIVAGVVLNYFILIPAYVALANFPLEVIIGMGTEIFPFINSTLSLVLVCVSLFNLVKGILVSCATVLLYKRVSGLLK